MLYQKKATIVAATFKNGTIDIPTRPIGPSTVPTKVDALIAKWNTPETPTKVTTDADGTITIPASAYWNETGLTTAKVTVMKSFDSVGTQLMSYGGDFYKPSAAALVYQLTAETAGTYYLTANHSVRLKTHATNSIATRIRRTSSCVCARACARVCDVCCPPLGRRGTRIRT